MKDCVEMRQTTLDNLQKRILPLIILLICALAYFQVVTFDIVLFDDPTYTTENQYVRKGLSWDGILWSFRSLDFNWHPITWISLMLDTSIYGGVSPGGLHFSSLVLHICNVLLVFKLAEKLTRDPWHVLLVTACFALHPLNSSAVCWISARKDLLAALFGLSSILFYINFRQQKEKKLYCLAICAACLSLMSKGTFISLPAILVLIDFFLDSKDSPSTDILKGIKAIKWINKLPFIAVAGTMIVVNLIAQNEVGAIVDPKKLPLSDRILYSSGYYIDYLAKAMFPGETAILYPEAYNLSYFKVALSIIFFGLALGLAAKIFRYYPIFLFGLLWFLVTMFPMVGIVKIGAHSITDRYTYVPYLGLFLIAGKLYLLSTKSLTSYIHVAVVIFLSILLGSLTFKQVAHWRDSETVFTHTLSHTEKNHVVEFFFATFLASEDRKEEAVKLYEKILSEADGVEFLHEYIADMYFSLNENKISLRHYSEALKYTEKPARVLNRMATLELRLSRYQSALALVQKALEIAPENKYIRRNYRRILSRAKANLSSE